MKVGELFESKIDWIETVQLVKRKLTKLFGEKVSFTGGYCFHLAAALLIEAKRKHVNAMIIADGGHAALYDLQNRVSIDSNGMHQEETALNERIKKRWTTVEGMFRALKHSWANKEQLDRLELILKEYE